jgi:hypothetical protein
MSTYDSKRWIPHSEGVGKVIHYWRFRRTYFYIATEVKPFWADVLASNGEEIVETEVKTNIKDLKAEAQKRKHHLYQEPTKYYSHFVPNKYYLAIPFELKDAAEEFIEGTPYGIIAVAKRKLRNNKDSCCYIHKPAGVIATELNVELLRKIIMRGSSELARFKVRKYHERWQNVRNRWLSRDY